MTPQDHNDRVIDQFTRWAERFDALPVHSEANAMARTIAACAVTDATTVLDVACGPGILTCELAAQAAHVTGVDLTPAMIAQAQKRQTAMNAPNVAWRVGDATALPFGDGAFDRVVTRYSFHHMPDAASALAEMRRVCRPDGRIVVIDATPAPDKQAAYDAMERLRDPSHASALTACQLRAMATELGLTEIVADGYRLEAGLETLSDPGTLGALTDLFAADIASGADRIGVQAYHADDRIRFFFPVSIFAWKIS